MNKNQQKKTTKTKKGTFARLIKYICKYYKIQAFVVIICIILSAISGSVATMFLQRLIDECITPGITEGLGAVWGQLISIIITMAVIYIIGVVASFIYTRLMAVITQGTLKNLRVEMFNQMETLTIKYFDTHPHGDIMSTYTNDTDTLRQLIGQSLPLVIQSVLSVASILFMMIYYSLWLTLLVAAIMMLMIYLTQKIGGGSSKYMIKQQQSLAKEEGFVEEMMNGQKVIKVFCHEDECKKDFVKYNEQLFEDGEKANTFGNILMPILNNIGNIMYVILAVVGGLLVFFNATNISLVGASTITIGIIVSFLSMSRQLSQTIGQISMQVSMVAMGLAGAERIFELIDQKSEEDNGYVTLVNANIADNGAITESSKKTNRWAWKHYHKENNTTTYTELKGDIVMDSVDFGYTKDKTVLHDISLYAHSGEKIAFVGSTGAGKTTITNLINRFYDTADGKIRYDGININKICKKDLRRSLGMVLQDVNLFTGTVMDNIRYGRLDATDQECINAAKLSNADSFITRLPDGYNTMLTSNGSNLSQGQRQLLSIARAEVADTPVMILDEATSSIDTRTESLVQNGMDKLMEGRTVFVIAHRLSTVRNSDAIMVLEHGRIIEKGTHQQLIKQHGTYYQLYTGAFEME